jgi:acyl-CoA dehydrogenase
MAALATPRNITERLFREVSLTRLAPISEQLIMCFTAEKVLDLPRSY